ncbi:MAG: hypothetical protein IPO95_08800 [Rhodanobacteraceae bacterium]|nr:hypothetical protein [Rhodanobacteraceae bacterium]
MAIESVVDREKDELIMAIGENGPELTPRSQTVDVEEIPVFDHPDADGWPVVPETFRSLFGGSPECWPAKLLDFAPSARLRGWFDAEWIAADGARAQCYVRDLRNVADPLFANLPDDDRQRMRDVITRELAP